MEQFKTALEARKAFQNLVTSMAPVPFNSDLNRMRENIDHMISDLSMVEVVARQQHKPKLLDKPIQEIYDAVNRYEKLLLMLKLMQ